MFERVLNAPQENGRSKHFEASRNVEIFPILNDAHLSNLPLFITFFSRFNVNVIFDSHITLILMFLSLPQALSET